MAMSQNGTAPATEQTVQIVPQQLSGGGFSDRMVKLVSLMLSTILGIIVILAASPLDVLEHNGLGLIIILAVIIIIAFASYRICKYSGGSPGRVSETGPSPTGPQPTPGEAPAECPSPPPQAPNRAPESRPATHTYTLLNSSTAGGNNSYPGRKDFYPSGSPRQTPPTGASSSGSYNPYHPYPSDSFPSAPEYQPPPLYAPGFGPPSHYDQPPPYEQISAAGPTAGTLFASAPDFDPPPPYPPPPYEK
ncbi:uncharacterized protein [Penaeus vannamei]|uniref:uncharacterized protein isoform X1 n=2 Tax=Penaeus vannamei TaxID=6689 RepID=UPI00387F55CB